MRRKYFGLAIAAFATIGPMQAWGGDREIAEQIIQRLKNNRDSGALKDFTLDMKVDNGVVLFRGSVSQEAQKQVVLSAADGIVGIAKVVDEVTVASTAKSSNTRQAQQGVADNSVAPAPIVRAAGQEEGFSFRNALAAQSTDVVPVAAVEASSDAEVVAAVVSALGQAKEAGQLRGFGVDVKSQQGILELTGRASSAAQRDAIVEIAQSVPGVSGVRESIAVPSNSPNMPRLPEPPALRDMNELALAPVAVDPARNAVRSGTPAMIAPHRVQSGGYAAYPVSTGAVANAAGGATQVMGQPVPMAPHSAVGAPRYDSPNLPNYAWPGYAAYPNYAAVTYPQQYSPTAWPYIGPFYPYPQVPLGWRRVSLEWDDGWWYLDFTDK
jgi:osmotically-inducible protein OsmY